MGIKNVNTPRQRVMRILERTKAPLSTEDICRKTRLKEYQVSEEINYLYTMGRIEMTCDNVHGTWGGFKGHDPMILRYSLKVAA